LPEGTLNRALRRSTTFSRTLATTSTTASLTYHRHMVLIRGTVRDPGQRRCR
jgi:hypothetical protein